jgi:hypothetical protein
MREMHREHILLLSDERLPEGCNVFRYLQASAIGQQEKLWPVYEEIVVLRWIAGAPGTRPRLWWKYSAPELRQIIAGHGEPLDLDVRNSHFGIPTKWKWIDPGDPPLFEAQAVYLRRHKFCIANESRRLRKRSHFNPDPVPREYWPRDAAECFADKETTQ